MKLKVTSTLAAVLFMTALGAFAQKQNDDELLRVREAVWRAWFDGNETLLKQLVPPGSIAINTGEQQWENQAEVLQSSADFHNSGAKLVRLEFPRTEVQHFENVAITYSQYLYEIEQGGTRSVHSGRATEIFVLRNGHWTNPGWHTDGEAGQ